MITRQARLMARQSCDANDQKCEQAQHALRQLLAEIVQKGFYGTAGIELAVQDGTIQNIRHRMERIER